MFLPFHCCHWKWTWMSVPSKHLLMKTDRKILLMPIVIKKLANINKLINTVTYAVHWYATLRNPSDYYPGHVKYAIPHHAQYHTMDSSTTLCPKHTLLCHPTMLHVHVYCTIPYHSTPFHTQCHFIYHTIPYHGCIVPYYIMPYHEQKYHIIPSAYSPTL